MTLVETNDTIAGWIGGCKTNPQLDLCMDVVRKFISLERFPREELPVIAASQRVLLAKVEFQMDLIAGK